MENTQTTAVRNSNEIDINIPLQQHLDNLIERVIKDHPQSDKVVLKLVSSETCRIAIDYKTAKMFKALGIGKKYPG